jgi:hypothetical protein
MRDALTHNDSQGTNTSNVIDFLNFDSLEESIKDSDFYFLTKPMEKQDFIDKWCQFHYLTGELYRRQRSDIYRCLSALKQMVLS